MNHFILLVLCFLSVEIVVRSNYFVLIKSIILVSKKSVRTISNKNISDHWKENIIPKYSICILKSSLKMLLVLSLIILIFFTADKLFNGLLLFTFSLNGIFESILFAFIFAYFRKFFINE